MNAKNPSFFYNNPWAFGRTKKLDHQVYFSQRRNRNDKVLFFWNAPDYPFTGEYPFQLKRYQTSCHLYGMYLKSVKMTPNVIFSFFTFHRYNMPIQKVMILSHERAAMFKAESKDKPIYFIRIFNSPDLSALVPYAELNYPEQFKIIRSYVFDDISQFTDDSNELALFNDEIAERIITDFDNEGKDCQTLLVHCWAGKSRSPALAIALSEIFHLQTPEQIADLKKQFSIYNKRVYHTMLDFNKSDSNREKEVSPSPHFLEEAEMREKDIRVADDFQFASAKIAQYTTDDLAESYLNNYQKMLKPIKLFLVHYAKEFPKLMRLLDYDKFIVTKATFMGEGGEKIVLRVTATIKESDENKAELNQPIEVGFGLRLHKGEGETFEEVSNGLENEFRHFKLFRRLNGVAIVFHKLYGTQRIKNSEAHFSYLENDPIRESFLKNHIYLVSVGEFVEGLDVGEILERENYDIGFKKNVIMESAKTLARTWLLSLKSEQAHENQPEKRVGLKAGQKNIDKYSQSCKKIVKLSDWAKSQGLSYKTAWRWFNEGKLLVPAEQMAW